METQLFLDLALSHFSRHPLQKKKKIPAVYGITGMELFGSYLLFTDTVVSREGMTLPIPL